MRPTVVHVVVPAHNEEQHVAGCLTALDAAVAALRGARPDVLVTVTLVLDRCHDRTRARALAHAGSLPLHLFVCEAGSVGAARWAGVLRALASHPSDPETTWVASTDADSEVEQTWLVDQLALARHHDLVVGAVQPGAGTLSSPALSSPALSSPALAEWKRRHTTGRLHVHGANLGIRASTYQAVGGFAPVSQHEDVLLVEAAIAAGARWVQGTLVTTSARPVGRTPGGFAGYLRRLELEVR